jgi:hypothetical protein
MPGVARQGHHRELVGTWALVLDAVRGFERERELDIVPGGDRALVGLDEHVVGAESFDFEEHGRGPGVVDDDGGRLEAPGALVIRGDT